MDPIKEFEAQVEKSILEFKDKISPDRLLAVRFEDLTNDISKSEEIFNFLELKGFDQAKAEAVFKQTLNAQKTGQFPKTDAWPDDLTLKLTEMCGETAAKLGYHHVHERKG